MKAACPTAPEPIYGIPMLVSLIDLMLHMCQCSQTQKTPASATMNMLFLAASSNLYSYFTNKTYQCSQTQKTPASATMNMLFLAALPDLYSYFAKKTYPSSNYRSQRKLMAFQTSRVYI
jgi:hypothetical protein